LYQLDSIIIALMLEYIKQKDQKFPKIKYFIAFTME